jgi:vitamin B12/bleomycin/antimicrobial peptide transport system ATP-binding/permease protein
VQFAKILANGIPFARYFCERSSPGNWLFTRDSARDRGSDGLHGKVHPYQSLLRDVAFASARGEALLIEGPTGAGKSTLLRAMAGIWPFGCGEITLGKGRMLFVPQRPYLPLGTLASALLYPRGDKCGVSTARLAAVLAEVGLGALADELDMIENWSQRLSLGEQQRFAFARILLMEPALLFLDEATSALDEISEAQLYGLLRAGSWRPTLVSVGHRSTLRNFHDHVLDVATFSSRCEQLPAMSNNDLDLLGCDTSEMTHYAMHSYCPLPYAIPSS